MFKALKLFQRSMTIGMNYTNINYCEEIYRIHHKIGYANLVQAEIHVLHISGSSFCTYYISTRFEITSQLRSIFAVPLHEIDSNFLCAILQWSSHRVLNTVVSLREEKTTLWVQKRRENKRTKRARINTNVRRMHQLCLTVAYAPSVWAFTST